MASMPAEFNATLESWRDAGKKSIPINYDFFRSLTRKAAHLLDREDFDSAAAYASMAAFHATSHHCGIWASPELERILRAIAARLPPNPVRSLRRQPQQINKICHVATTVYPVGGHTRMLSRWIRQDGDRQHSLVLTRQLTEEVPAFLQQAIMNSKGRIHFADVAGGLIERARMLRQVAAQTDVVVLHIHSNDVVPIIALATDDRPPVIFLDHGDHLFWLGATVSDVVANMRDAGRRLSIERRGIDPRRIALLPTILEPVQRRLSRQSAKSKLNLPLDSILLCSVGRAAKYRPLSGTTYADLHVPTLLEHEHCFLLVIGPGDQQDWSHAYRRTNHRVIALPEQRDPSLYFQAADIYLDSFPFCSITSMLESGSYGTPAVSLFPYSEDCKILGSNMSGLDGSLLACRSIAEYRTVLSQLINNKSWRHSVGQSLRQSIIKEHTNGNWQHALDAVYNLAFTLPFNTQQQSNSDQINIGEPDVYLQSIFGSDGDPEEDSDGYLRYQLGLFPPKTRIREWWRLLRARRLNINSRYGPFVLLLPEWACCRAGRFRRRITRRAMSRVR